MSNYELSYKFLTIRLKPKDSYSTLRSFTNKYKRCDNYTFLKRSCEVLKELKQERYLLQMNDGVSYESCFFNIVSDSTGYYIYDKNEIRHFRKKENALKYKLSKCFLQKFDYANSIEYFCFNYDIPEKSKEDFINNSFLYGRRILI